MALKITLDRKVNVTALSVDGLGEITPTLPAQTNQINIPTGFTIKLQFEYRGEIVIIKFSDWRKRRRKNPRNNWRGNDAWADWTVQNQPRSQHFDGIDGRKHDLVIWPFKLTCEHIPAEE